MLRVVARIPVFQPGARPRFSLDDARREPLPDEVDGAVGRAVVDDDRLVPETLSSTARSMAARHT